jgi:hypothetical protein
MAAATSKKSSSSGGGFTSFKDMFDSGGKGGSGSEFSTKSHDDYKQDYKEKHGNNDPNANSHLNNSAMKESGGGGGFTSFADMFDGGGKAGAGSEFSSKSHAEYKDGYKAKHGGDDPKAKSHLAEGTSGGGKNPATSDLDLTITETKLGLQIIAKSATGVEVIVIAPKGTPKAVIEIIAKIALDYADAVNRGNIYSQKNHGSVKIDIADLDGANGQFSPMSGVITIDYTPSAPRSVSQVAATTSHELTHKYSASLHKSDVPATKASTHHSAEFYELVDKAARAIGLDPGISGTGHPNAEGALPFNGDNYPRDQTRQLGHSDFDFRDDFYEYLDHMDATATKNAPILLDLDGDGVQITELNRSTRFVDGGEGLLHRTAWGERRKRSGGPFRAPNAGNGVLFFDPDGRNAITEKRQYVFTEWNATASGDLEAVRSVWDSNGDGKLTVVDADFAKFKVLVTNADGRASVQTLTQLGITEINLTADTTHIESLDGSVITGQTTFTRGNGTTGTVANTTLRAA